MNFYALASAIVIIVSIGLVLLVRRNLRQRTTARRFRAIFISAAEDLVSKPDFPAEHAKQLADAAAIPQGWITRFMVVSLLKEMFLGKSSNDPLRTLSFEKVPKHLRTKYVVAIFSLALGDSYRCALLGRLWRGANLWVLQGVKEPKVDVDAHATRRMVEQVNYVRAPSHVRKTERRLEGCAA